MSTYYMNSVTKAPKETQPPASGFECDLNDKKNGTPLYHNCDVPNVVTDVIQNIVGTVMPSGPKNANKRDAYVPEGFGLPSYIPDDEIPVDPRKREFKTTGLELFGYSMTYTSYLGEWDHISVMNSTRMLTNFGWADKTIARIRQSGEELRGVGRSYRGSKERLEPYIFHRRVLSGFAKGSHSNGQHATRCLRRQRVFCTRLVSLWLRFHPLQHGNSPRRGKSLQSPGL